MFNNNKKNAAGLINEVTGQFTAMVQKLDAALDLLRVEQSDNVDHIQALKSRNEDIASEIGDAENIKANINQLVGGADNE